VFNIIFIRDSGKIS